MDEVLAPGARGGGAESPAGAPPLFADSFGGGGFGGGVGGGLGGGAAVNQAAGTGYGHAGFPAEPRPVDVDLTRQYQGYLDKSPPLDKPRWKRLMASWRNRWFVVDKDGCRYHAVTASGGRLKGLPKEKVLVPVPLASFSLYEASAERCELPKRPYGCCLRVKSAYLPNGRTDMVLQAENPSDRDLWIAVFNKFAEWATENEPPPDRPDLTEEVITRKPRGAKREEGAAAPPSPANIGTAVANV